MALPGCCEEFGTQTQGQVARYTQAQSPHEEADCEGTRKYCQGSGTLQHDYQVLRLRMLISYPLLQRKCLFFKRMGGKIGDENFKYTITIFSYQNPTNCCYSFSGARKKAVYKEIIFKFKKS